MRMVEKRQLVVPGDLLAEGDYVAGENTYKEGNRIYSQKIGLVDFDDKKIFVVPLKGRYIPKIGDVVIGQIVDVSLSGWTVDINSPYKAVLGVPEVVGKSFSPKLDSLTKILDVGDVIVGKIVSFDRTKDPALTIKGEDLGKISDGIIVKLTPTKVPRLIGKKGSMINMIKRETGCEIIVGQNGRIFIRSRNPEKIELVVKAIKMVEEQAHTTGLTDRVKEFLKTVKGVKND